MTITLGTVEDLVRVVDSAVVSGLNVRSLSRRNKVAGAVQAVGVVVGATNETLKFATAVGATTTTVLGVVALGLGVAPILGQLVYKDYNQEHFGKTPPETFKELQQKEMAGLQLLLSHYNGPRVGAPKPQGFFVQADNLNRLTVGAPLETSTRPDGVIGLKQMGAELLQLPLADKRRLVFLFTAAARAYNGSAQIKPSENSTLLARYLDPVDKSVYQQFLQDIFTDHGLKLEVLKLMESNTFPDNLSTKGNKKGYRDEFKPLCDVDKLKMEHLRVILDFKERNQRKYGPNFEGQGKHGTLTPEEVKEAQREYDEFGWEFSVDVGTFQDYLHAFEQEKIHEQMEWVSIISDKTMHEAQRLQNAVAHRTTPDIDPDIVVESKLEAIVVFLAKMEYGSKLAKCINKELNEHLGLHEFEALREHLDAHYKDTLQPIMNGIQVAVKQQMAPEIKKQVTATSPKSWVKFFQKPQNNLDHGAAFAFYDLFLKNEDKREFILRNFQEDVDNIESPHEDTPGSIPKITMGEIATLMGKLNPLNENDQAAFLAYVDLLKEMNYRLGEKPLTLPNNQAICDEYLLSLEIINKMAVASFSTRGVSKESLDNIKETVSTGLSVISKGVTIATIAFPVAAPITGPIAAATSITSSVMNIANFAGDISSQSHLVFLLPPKQAIEVYYSDACRNVSFALENVIASKTKLIEAETRLGRQYSKVALQGEVANRAEMSTITSMRRNVARMEFELSQTLTELEALQAKATRLKELPSDEDQSNTALQKAAIYEEQIDALLDKCNLKVEAIKQELTKNEEELRQHGVSSEVDAQVGKTL